MTAPLTAASSPRRRSSRHGPGAETSKMQKEEQKKLEKIKASKAFKKRKKHADDSEDDDDIAQAIFEQSHAPLPGQMENCAICDKRFTVTPYSVSGPNGGLLCAPCGREVAKQRQGQNPPKKKPRKQAGGVGNRRVAQSRILDGEVGMKSLATLCVHTLANNVHMADDLGDLAEDLIDMIARLFSKRRLLKSETLPLFVRPSTEVLSIYDGARLREHDFIQTFQVATKMRHLKVRYAIQFKDEVMDYFISRNIALESMYLHGANLLSEEKWHEFLLKRGRDLKGLQVYYTDKHFGDETIGVLGKHCPNLCRLKIENNQKLTGNGVRDIGHLARLEHLGLQLQNNISSSAITHVLSRIGPQLQTLSLKIVPNADDEVLKSIHENCRSLRKLRITDSEAMTDQGFVGLFSGWANPPLSFLDLQKCRHMDSAKPRSNSDQVGLCSAGFTALMAHSGSKLRSLNVHACRHISRQAFEDVFMKGTRYPELTKLEISFCEEVTDYIIGLIFLACPKIKEVNVFGCMKVKEVLVPRGVILVGVPNARGMITEGTE